MALRPSCPPPARALPWREPFSSLPGGPMERGKDTPVRRFAPLAVALLLASPAQALDPEAVDRLAGDWDRFAELQALGPEVLPVLADLYAREPEPDRRRTLANVFYRLGWESPEAKRVLLRDVDTDHPDLRLAVQWALGRVSGDADVVPRLLEIMRRDPNPLFRDKAACALASDQIHLDPGERVRLLRGLVDSLEHRVVQVRGIAIQALEVQTRQTKGFRANAPAAERRAAVERWRKWLHAYERSL